MKDTRYIRARARAIGSFKVFAKLSSSTIFLICMTRIYLRNNLSSLEACLEPGEFGATPLTEGCPCGESSACNLAG